MKRPKAADILQPLNPKFDKKAISLVLQHYITPISRKLCRSNRFKITVPLLGQFRTHGNKKFKVSAAKKRYFRKYHKKLNAKKHQNWTEEQLLYK